MNSEIVAKGRECVVAARNVLDQLNTKQDVQKAVECLGSLKEHARHLKSEAESAREDCRVKQQELEKQLADLEEEKRQHQSRIDSLNYDKREAENRLERQRNQLSRYESELRDAYSRLEDAEADLRRAKRKEKDIMTGAVVGGTVLGLFTFGLGGLAAGAAVGAGVGALINEIEGRVRRARRDIRNKEDAIVVSKRDISNTESSLYSMRSNISDYERRIEATKNKQSDIHCKIGNVKKDFAHHKELALVWDLFIQAAENASERTQKLEEFLSRAAKREDLKILGSKGSINKVHNTIEACEKLNVNKELSNYKELHGKKEQICN